MKSQTMTLIHSKCRHESSLVWANDWNTGCHNGSHWCCHCSALSSSIVIISQKSDWQLILNVGDGLRFIIVDSTLWTCSTPHARKYVSPATNPNFAWILRTKFSGTVQKWNARYETCFHQSNSKLSNRRPTIGVNDSNGTSQCLMSF